MEYRRLPHGNEMIGVIGLGSASIGTARIDTAAKTVEAAFKGGINYFDLASSGPNAFYACGEVLKDVREKIHYQIHFGADYSEGKYGWTTDPDTIRKSVEWQLDTLSTDYIDFGFIHCIDEEKDLHTMEENGIIPLIVKLKKEGIIHHIGLSTHTPSIAERILDMDIIDMLMFSINPCYDYTKGEFGIGTNSERMNLYRRCEKEGVGISVMKAFAGGQLLDAKLSSFGKALTKNQLIQYALDRPGVITVLPGAASPEEVNEVLSFFDSEETEKDYSEIGQFKADDAKGRCVYCNHCQPCPARLDIALINKYYDLAKAGDELAKEHYISLDRHASECLGCGHCSARCPFEVNQYQRMMEIAEYFGI